MRVISLPKTTGNDFAEITEKYRFRLGPKPKSSNYYYHCRKYTQSCTCYGNLWALFRLVRVSIGCNQMSHVTMMHYKYYTCFPFIRKYGGTFMCCEAKGPRMYVILGICNSSNDFKMLVCVDVCVWGGGGKRERERVCVCVCVSVCVCVCVCVSKLDLPHV